MAFGQYLFLNRLDAALTLADLLQDYKGRHPLVLAIPRGAVPMGKELADRLGGELDIVLVRKIGAPFNPEFALGAVDEDGWVHMTATPHDLGVSEKTIEEERLRQLDVMKQRRALYTPFRQAIDPAGRIVIIVDDGLATGATMIAALHAVRAKQPAELVCAVPVAARDSAEKVALYADRLACPCIADDFMSVGQFYRDFSQVDDQEVIRILAQGNEGGGAPP